jgi:hypothetical protein
MKKKQDTLDKFIQQTKAYSEKCFGKLMSAIKSELENFIPPNSVNIDEVKQTLAQSVERYSEKFNTIVDLPMSEKPDSLSTYPIYEAKDIPEEIRGNASAELQSLAGDRKVRCILQRSIEENSLRFVFWYRGTLGIIREIVRI